MAGPRGGAKYVARGGMTAFAVKRAVRERDGHACTKCGVTADEHIRRHGRTLQVHRQVPGSLYTPDGCVTLCCACHAHEPKRASGETDSEGTQFNARLDPETEVRIARLIPVISAAIGLPVSQADLLRLGMMGLERVYGVVPPDANPQAKPRGRPRKSP